ncbi:MAG: hypothetical protein HQL69_10795 [Magnetococcales bacterium]|nr:hypothetical protein [Magnetococcales bacterium]
MKTSSDMQEIIEELMREHRDILMLFLQAFALDINSDKGKSIFKNAFLDLQLHDDKEELMIYKPIRDSYLDKNNPEDLNIFRDIKLFGIEKTLMAINDFENSLDNDDSPINKHLESKYLLVIEAIKQRVKFEEQVLFELFKRIKS